MCISSSRIVAIGWIVLKLASPALGQLGASQFGLHYYAVQDRSTGGVIQRGTAGAAGIAFSKLIVGPKTNYRIWILQATTLKLGSVDITTPDNGLSFSIPQILVDFNSTVDSDGDGLNDLGELILGTDPTLVDTDGDGIEDGAEVAQGLNPLDGFPVATGIVASVDTPGTATDICALNDLAVVADSDRGVSIFNVFNGMSPTIVAQVDTPGTATAVACEATRVAVADGTAGLAIVDFTDPPAARITHQLTLGSSANAVAMAGGIAYVGLQSGVLVAVDVASGTELQRKTISSLPIQDVAVGGDALYVLVAGTLYTIGLGGPLDIAGSVSSPGSIGAGGRRLRLFIGDSVAYAIHTQGYNTFGLTDPLHPTLIRNGTSSQFGWKHIVANGSGLGLAAVGTNSTNDGPHNVSLYDLKDPSNTNAFLTEFETPGIASAVGIYNGLVYTADSGSGLQVINYVAYDSQKVPPTISLSTNFAPGVAEEGKLMRVTAHVTDDVQVRNVEFYVDGIKVATDGNFPFEYRFVTPLISERPTLTIQARASDTGGNSTLTDVMTITLTPDATAPFVKSVSPAQGTQSAAIASVAAFFNEPISLDSLSTGFTMMEAGPDFVFDTADDVAVTGGVLEFRDDVNGAFLTFDPSLRPGNYRAQLSTGVTDLAGNPLTGPYIWTFTVLASTTVVGVVQTEVGAPATGVTVSVRSSTGSLLGSGLSTFGGAFSIAGVASAPGAKVSVNALLVTGDGPLVGVVSNILTVPDGVTNAGTITLVPGFGSGMAYAAGLSTADLSALFDSAVSPVIPTDASFTASGDGVIFTGNFLKIGVNRQGSFNYNGFGMRFAEAGDGVSFGSDVLYPGYIGDGWAARFDSGGTSYYGYGGAFGGVNNGNVTTISFDKYDGPDLKVARSITSFGPLQFSTITILPVGERVVYIDVTIMNTGAAAVENLRYLRSAEWDVNGGTNNSFDVFDTPGGGTIISAGNPGVQYFGVCSAPGFSVADGQTFTNPDPDHFSNHDPDGAYGDFSASFVYRFDPIAPGDSVSLLEANAAFRAGGSGGISGTLGELGAGSAVEIECAGEHQIVVADDLGNFSADNLPLWRRVSIRALGDGVDPWSTATVLTIPGAHAEVFPMQRSRIEAIPSPQKR